MKKHSEIDWAKLVKLGKELVGRPYVFGAEVKLNDPNPASIKAIDCSELTEWLFHQIGLELADGSYNQDKMCRPVAGELLLGDLGFKADPETDVIHHVGVYIGDNTVLEAKGKNYGVVLTPLATYMASTHFFRWGRLKSIQEG